MTSKAWRHHQKAKAASGEQHQRRQAAATGSGISNSGIESEARHGVNVKQRKLSTAKMKYGENNLKRGENQQKRV